MIKLSKKADYAVVALSHLCSTQESASARQIAMSYDLSAQMLANVLKVLASAGLVSSKRGMAGGYSLGRAAEEIFLGEVIELIDGNPGLSDCVNLEKTCTAENRCPAQGSMMMIHKKIKDFMGNLSLADIAEKQSIPEIQV